MLPFYVTVTEIYFHAHIHTYLKIDIQNVIQYKILTVNT